MHPDCDLPEQTVHNKHTGLPGGEDRRLQGKIHLRYNQDQSRERREAWREGDGKTASPREKNVSGHWMDQALCLVTQMEGRDSE